MPAGESETPNNTSSTDVSTPIDDKPSETTTPVVVDEYYISNSDNSYQCDCKIYSGI